MYGIFRHHVSSARNKAIEQWYCLHTQATHAVVTASMLVAIGGGALGGGTPWCDMEVESLMRAAKTTFYQYTIYSCRKYDPVYLSNILSKNMY